MTSNLPAIVPRRVWPHLPQICFLFSCAVLLTACCRPVWADERSPSADDQARSLAVEVLKRAGSPGPDGLGDWTRSVIGRALNRAGSTASPAPLPAEREAARLAASRRNSGEVIVFTSLAVPAASWRQWAHEAARTGAPLVLRGVAQGSLRATVKAIGERLGGAEAGVAIDPRLFRLFGVKRVPAVAVVPGGVPACHSRGCAGDAPPPFDLVTGNIGLEAALEAVAAEGSAGRDVARRALGRLQGEVAR